MIVQYNGFVLFQLRLGGGFIARKDGKTGGAGVGKIPPYEFVIYI